VAALAFGTKAFQGRQDRGPGNAYVTEAKRQVFGYADIDMLAGPTELVVIANRFSDPEFVIADLESQEEHAGGLSILISTSKRLIRQVNHGLQRVCHFCQRYGRGCEISNRIAPEHCRS